MGKRAHILFFIFGLCPILLGGTLLYDRWNAGDDSALLGGAMIMFGMAGSVVGLLVPFDARHLK